MKDYLELGTTPYNEECVQVNPLGDYHESMLMECKRYKSQLENMFPASVFPDVYFKIKWYPHDFGSYAEVVVIFDDNDKESMTQAYYIEDHLPDNWAESDSDN
jgi:hypothetical protein